MNATAIALVVFGAILAGIAVGWVLRDALPGHHLSEDSKDPVELAAGLVATLTALVLGLLVSSAADLFETEKAELNQIAAQTILLDRMMADYGPQTRDARENLRRSVISRLELISPEKGSQRARAGIASDADLESVQAALRALSPDTAAQKTLQTQAVLTAHTLAQTRWLLMVQEEEGTIPMPFIVILAVWLTAIFASFSLFAPRNATTVTALVVGAVSVTGAVFLILELGNPYGGVIRLSPTPLRIALEYLGR